MVASAHPDAGHCRSDPRLRRAGPEPRGENGGQGPAAHRRRWKLGRCAGLVAADRADRGGAFRGGPGRADGGGRVPDRPAARRSGLHRRRCRRRTAALAAAEGVGAGPGRADGFGRRVA